MLVTWHSVTSGAKFAALAAAGCSLRPDVMQSYLGVADVLITWARSQAEPAAPCEESAAWE
jgi:hypothetical protein